MAEYGEHIIQKLCFEISVGDPGQAEALQSRISEMVPGNLEKELDDLFGKLAGERHLVVDRLELDLGSISSDSLERNLIRAIRGELRSELHALAGGGREGEEGEWNEPEILFLDALAHYLRTGSYPWYVTRQMKEEKLGDPEKLLAELAESRPDALREMLREGMGTDYFRKRLARAFGDRSLELVAGLFSPALREAWREVLQVAGILRTIGAGPLRPERLTRYRVREIMLSRLGRSNLADATARKASRLLYVALLRDMRLTGTSDAPRDRHRALLAALGGEPAGEGESPSLPAGARELGQTGLGRTILRQAREERLLRFLEGREKGPSGRRDGQYALLSRSWVKQLRYLAAKAELSRLTDELMDRPEKEEGERWRIPVSALRELAEKLSRRVRTLPGMSGESESSPAAEAGEEGPPPTGKAEEGNAWDSELREDTADRKYFVSNGGLVLLWPYLTDFFRKLEFIVDGEFIDEPARVKAVHLLQYLAAGSEETYEHRMVLNKLLCGYELEFPLPSDVDFSESEKEEAGKLIRSAIGHWDALKDTSPEGFREAFIQRHARLSREEGHWGLQVEPEAWDVLLERLPWSLSVVKLPWMAEALYVEWR